MAVVQASATTGKPKKPRIQAIVSESTLSRLEAYAESNGWSTSRAVDTIICRYLDQQEAAAGAPGAISDATPAQITKKITSEEESMAKFLKVLELAKASGVL